MIAGQDLVWALSLDVTRLLALVASSLWGGLGWAIPGEMSDFTAVVALLALGAVTCIVRTSKGMGDVETYETCGRNHRRSSRFVHLDHRHHVHRIHHRNHPVDHRNHHRLVVLHIHRPLGSYGQCDRSLSTVLILSRVQGSNQQCKAYLVALLGSTTTGWESTASTSSSLGSWVGAVTRDVTWLTALVASLVLWSLWALTAFNIN